MREFFVFFGRFFFCDLGFSLVMESASVDSSFMEKTKAMERLLGRSGGVRWCEKAFVESSGLRSYSPNSTLNQYERASITAMLSVNDRLVTVQASVDALQELTRRQKMVLGIPPRVQRLEVSQDIINTPMQETHLPNFRNDSPVKTTAPHNMMTKRSPLNTAERVEQQIAFQNILSERNRLSRLLTEAQNEIDDLRYEHAQQTRLLRKELEEERDVVTELRAKESSLLNETFSAREEVKQLKNSTEALGDALKKYRVLEQSIQDEPDFMERRNVFNVKHLEDALAAATKMNSILLENADRQDVVYRSALSEVDCLRGKLTEMRATMESERQMYEERFEEMKEEMVSLKYFKERMSKDKLLECAKQGKCAAAHDDEIARFHVPLTHANSLIATLKKENAALATLTPIRAKGRDVFVQGEVIVQCDKNVGTSSFLDEEGNIPVRELTVESRRLSHGCDEYREELEAMKQIHAAEIRLLTEKLIKSESELQSNRFKLNSLEQVLNSSTALHGVNMGVNQEPLHLPIKSVQVAHVKSTKNPEAELKEAKKPDNVAKEKYNSNNSDDDDEGTSLRNPSAETVVGPYEAELQPPITVDLSPRAKRESENDTPLVQLGKTPRVELMDSSGCFTRSEVKHSTQTCLWCSNKLNQSLEHLFNDTRSCRSSYLQPQ